MTTIIPTSSNKVGNLEVIASVSSVILQVIWADFVHKTDELVVLAEGEIEVEIEGKAERPQIGEEVFIPANAVHTVRNVGQTNNVWFYGYKSN